MEKNAHNLFREKLRKKTVHKTALEIKRDADRQAADTHYIKKEKIDATKEIVK